jgi:hypothetical protein|tara:strand:+ start:44 stop:619 length:576 start_codon:yes stop_codon:yes gene_type:complete
MEDDMFDNAGGGVARLNAVNTPLAQPEDNNPDAGWVGDRDGLQRRSTKEQNYIDGGIEEYNNARSAAGASRRAAIDKRRAKLELNRDRTLEDSGRAEIRRLREARQGFSARGTGRSGFEQRKLGEISSDAELKRSRMLADLKEVFDDMDKKRASSGGGALSSAERAKLTSDLEEQYAYNTNQILTEDLYNK